MTELQAIDRQSRQRAAGRRYGKKRYALDPEPQKARTKAWYAANRERAAEYHKAYRARKREEKRAYFATYYERHRDHLKARVRQRSIDKRVELRPYNAARAMKRIAARLQATPAWANPAAIATFYAESARRKQESGLEHHVDHIVPLQSGLVCGLHVEANLQVLHGPENQRKSNRWWPDCP